MRETRGQKIFKVFNYTFLGLLGLATFYPFWYVLVASLNEGRDFMRGGVWFFPRVLTWENYAKAFNDDRIGPSLQISVSATLIIVVASLLLTALVAYALTVKTVFSFFWYFTTIFSGGLIPYYLVLRDLKLTSSFWLYIIPSLFSFTNFILMRANFSGIPYELRESAQLDGAGEWTILSRIYLPLSKPILATLALLIGVGKWNDWFTGAYYQSQAKLYPSTAPGGPTASGRACTQSTGRNAGTASCAVRNAMRTRWCGWESSGRRRTFSGRSRGTGGTSGSPAAGPPSPAASACCSRSRSGSSSRCAGRPGSTWRWTRRAMCPGSSLRT